MKETQEKEREKETASRCSLRSPSLLSFIHSFSFVTIIFEIA